MSEQHVEPVFQLTMHSIPFRKVLVHQPSTTHRTRHLDVLAPNLEGVGSMPMKRSEALKLLSGMMVFSLLQLIKQPDQAMALGGNLPELDTLAPDFDLEATSQKGVRGQRLKRDDFRGSWLILYFYPRDFTTGCTLEARGFQRDLPAFKQSGAAVVGISADGSDDHSSFCSSEGLDYPLLSDKDGVISKRYGSWIPPFSQRHTFLIDPKGILRASWLGVSPSRHSQDVLNRLIELQTST